MAVGPSTVRGLTTDYTQEINQIPNTYSRINSMGLFTFEGVATTTVTIDKEENTLVILPEGPRGWAGTTAQNKPGASLTLRIPHIPHKDYLKPEDIQDRRRPGDTGPDTITRKTAKKLNQLRRKHMLTFEYLKMGAIKGIITGGSGNIVYNLFTEFGITQDTVFFDLSNTATNVASKCRDLLRLVEDGVEDGGIIEGVHVFVSPEFFDALISHSSTIEAYANFQAANQMAVAAADRVRAQEAGRQPLRDDLRRGFYHAGVMFEENRAKGNLIGGSTQRFIDANEGHAFPTGVDDLFVHYGAPANKMGYVNTEGMEMYAFTFEDGKDNGIEFESESSPLPICRRPKSLVKVSAAAS